MTTISDLEKEEAARILGRRKIPAFQPGDTVQPNRLVRLAGALGPLAATGGAGHLAIRLAPKNGGTALDLTYDFGGYAKGGMAQWAAPVDGVLGEQVARLKRYVETGKPDG